MKKGRDNVKRRNDSAALGVILTGAMSFEDCGQKESDTIQSPTQLQTEECEIYISLTPYTFDHMEDIWWRQLTAIP